MLADISLCWQCEQGSAGGFCWPLLCCSVSRCQSAGSASGPGLLHARACVPPGCHPGPGPHALIFNASCCHWDSGIFLTQRPWSLDCSAESRGSFGYVLALIFVLLTKRNESKRSAMPNGMLQRSSSTITIIIILNINLPLNLKHPLLLLWLDDWLTGSNGQA